MTLSLELVTVVVAGPLALWVAWCVSRDLSGNLSGMSDENGEWEGKGKVSGKTWWWATVLAIGECYGG